MAFFLEEKILRRFFKEGYYTAPEVDALLTGLGGSTTLTGDVTGTGTGTIVTTVADNSHNHLWSNITSTPTTLVGYGITDAATSAQGALADTALQPSDTIDGGTF